jgi:hypothetical protein
MTITRDGLIELYRTNHVGIDRHTPVELWIDNVPRGEVLPYETMETAIVGEPHRVEVKAQDAVSKELHLEVAPDEKVRLTVSSRPGMAWFNSLLLGKACVYDCNRSVLTAEASPPFE